MSGISGSRRERKDQDFGKKVGLFEGTVVAINPTAEQFKDVLGIELAEDSKATEYAGESKDGNATLRVSIWLKDVKSGHHFNANFFLEDKERENKDGSKKQYINQVGNCTWASDEDQLPQWFKGTASQPRDYRVAYSGEEELYEFLRTWIYELDYSKADTILSIDWKKLMRGNLKELTSQIGGELTGNVIAMATVVVREKDGESKEFQGVYNRAFLPAYAIKNFRLVNYDDPKKIKELSAKKPKDMKLHEKFVVKLTGEYGCKDYFLFKELEDYDPEKNLVASDRVIEEDDADY
jgi:hypothetical protein